MNVDVKLFDDLEAVAADAGDALDRARQPSLYDRIDWFQRLATHCPIPGTPLIARARNGKGSAWLFLAKRGSAAQGLANWYTLEYDAVRLGETDGLIARIAARLEGVASVALSPVAEPESLLRGFRDAGWIAEATPATLNWQVHPPERFDDYWESRPSRLRNTVKRKARKANLGIEIHTRFDETAWAAYRRIYEQSWKPEEGSWDFMRAFAEAEGAAGTLRLGIARHQGEPVAAQFWLVESGRATIYKLVYAESAREMSAGAILGEAMFRHVIEQDRPRVIDYGTGNEPYKAEWMDAPRQLWRVAAWNPRHPAAWPGLARRAVKSLLRRTK